VIEIKVYGLPAPQGSKKFLGTKNGRGIVVESSKAVKPWREAVKSAALDVLSLRELTVGAHCNGGVPGPIVAEMIFTVPKPKSAPKSRKTYPDRKPDLSKLIRSTEDALSDVGAWEDDARVVEYKRTAKVFPGEDPDALHVPGAVIRISTLEGR